MSQGSVIKDAESSAFTIPANSMFDHPASGEFVRCLEATGNFKLSVNHGGRFYFAGGMEYRPPGIVEFESFQLYNDTGDDIEVIMSWGGGELRDNRVSLQSGKVDGFTTIPDETLSTVAAQVLAPNSARNEAIICNLDDAIDVFIGGANLDPATTRGTKLAPGQTAVLQHTAAIYAFAASGTPKIGISYTED